MDNWFFLLLSRKTFQSDGEKRIRQDGIKNVKFAYDRIIFIIFTQKI